MTGHWQPESPSLWLSLRLVRHGRVRRPPGRPHETRGAKGPESHRNLPVHSSLRQRQCRTPTRSQAAASRVRYGQRRGVTVRPPPAAGLTAPETLANVAHRSGPRLANFRVAVSNRRVGVAIGRHRDTSIPRRDRTTFRVVTWRHSESISDNVGRKRDGPSFKT